MKFSEYYVFPSEIIHADAAVHEWWSIMNLFSNCQKEKTEVIPEAVLSEVSKLIESVMSEGQEEQKNSFLENKGLHKIQNGFTINKQPERS